VLDIDMVNKRISLGLRQLDANPWDELMKKHPLGSTITGPIKSITDFGIFVGITEGIDGLIHLSDISWTGKVKNLNEIYKIGQEIEAKVLNIEKENERFTLGLKQLAADPWELLPKKYPTGSNISGKVTGITDFGVFLEVEEGIEGLIHVSELSKERVAKPQNVVNLGDVLNVKVLNIDPKARKISLSVKSFIEGDDVATVDDYMKGQSSSKIQFGDLVRKNNKKDRNP
jgi:small subunit ribosomal protein S1